MATARVIVVDGSLEHLLKKVVEFQTDDKVQFVRQTMTKDFGSDGMVLSMFCITFTV